MLRLSIQVSPAEVIDRYLILLLKTYRLSDPVKLEHAYRGMEGMAVAHSSIPSIEGLKVLRDGLWCCHQALWIAEDEIRKAKYDRKVAEIARKIIQFNNERASLKRQIDELLGAEPGEVKEYAGGSDSR